MSAFLFIKSKRELGERIDRILDYNMAMNGDSANEKIKRWRDELT